MLPRDEGSATTAVKPLGFDLPDGAAEVHPRRNFKSQVSTVATAKKTNRTMSTSVDTPRANHFGIIR